MPVSRISLKRIFKLYDIFEKLVIGPLDEECVRLPFSTQVKALDYKVDVKYTKPKDSDSLDIMTKDLNLKIYTQNDGYWDEPLTASLNRVAELGHFADWASQLTNTGP